MLPLLVAGVLLAASAGNPALGPRRQVDWRPLSNVAFSRFAQRLEIKFRDKLQPVVVGDAIVAGDGRTLLKLADVRGRAAALLVDSPGKWRVLEDNARARCGCELADLTSYVRVEVALDEQGLQHVLRWLNASDDVEVAYPLQIPAPLPVDIAPTTPSFVTGQTYFDAAPDGLDVGFARALPGGRGEGISFVDMEVDWSDAHEDLATCTGRQVPEVGTIYPDLPYEHYGAHGTAVLSMIAAGDNGYGVTGMAPLSTCNYAPDYTQQAGPSAARALLKSVETGTLQAGDVFLMESQIGGPDYNEATQEGLVPSEWEPATFDAIRTLTAAGVIVVEAAGNGYRNLDLPQYNGAFDRAQSDSGAIVVGAGYSPVVGAEYARGREEYSNWGSRVDVQAWGDNVYSAGYGDLFSAGGDRLQYYSSSFAGTSSASPMIASAAILLQSVQIAGGGTLLTPAEVRAILSANGTPQTGNTSEHIGVLPDLSAAIPATRVCGNNRRDALEVCEDGNTTDGDGCSARCNSDERCGNSITDTAVGEQCDDGNETGGDGCSATCRSNETCGNGALDGAQGELCDDGNTTAGDGCSADCRSVEVCGNGILDAARGEQCDDANTTAGDGCDADCTPTPEGPGGALPGGPLALPGCSESAPGAPWLLLVLVGVRGRRGKN